MLAFTPWRMVEAELYTQAQLPTAKLGVGCSASARAEFRRFKSRNGEGMVFVNDVVRALLPVCGQVAIGQVVAGQTLGSRYSCAFENHQGETCRPTHVNLVGGQTRCRADRIVVSELDVRELQIPVLSFVDDHSKHLGHSVVHPLNASVAVRMIGACGKLAHSQQLVYSL